MMRPCDKCLKNSWAFKVSEGVAHATCDNCGNSVEFKARGKTENKKEPRKKDFFRKEINVVGAIEIVRESYIGKKIMKLQPRDWKSLTIMKSG